MRQVCLCAGVFDEANEFSPKDVKNESHTNDNTSESDAERIVNLKISDLILGTPFAVDGHRHTHSRAANFHREFVWANVCTIFLRVC